MNLYQVRPYGLTWMELKILKGFSMGGTVLSLAEHFQIQKKTVNRHMSNAMKKMEVHTRAQALYICGRERIL